MGEIYSPALRLHVQQDIDHLIFNIPRRVNDFLRSRDDATHHLLIFLFHRFTNDIGQK